MEVTRPMRSEHPTTMDHLTELRALAAGAEPRRTETGIPRVAMVKGRSPSTSWRPCTSPWST